MPLLFLTLYRVIFWPILLFLLPILCLFNKKLHQGLLQRFKQPNWPKLAQPVIWFHASSGEFEYAKPLIRECKNRFPHCFVVVTYFSPTYRKAIEQFAGVDFSCPLPLDMPGPMSTLMRQMKPRALLIAKTDLWPEMLYQARAHKIPAVLFSAAKSTKMKPWQRSLHRLLGRWFSSWLSAIFTSSDADRLNFIDLNFSCPVNTLGDSRYDQVIARLKQPKDLRAGIKPKSFTVVAGSTWPEDEKILVAACEPLLKQGLIKLIIAPHEPTKGHLLQLQRLFTENDSHGQRLPSDDDSHGLRKSNILRIANYSTVLDYETWDVLFIDQVGILAELYSWGQVAFVGGSFKKTVHSVMEPLAAGVPVIVGPYVQNNREAQEFSQQAVDDQGTRTAANLGSRKAVRQVHSVDELRAVIEDWYQQRDHLPQISLTLRQQILMRSGASKRIVNEIQNYMN